MTRNNHYVPQFILRRYGNKINKYNIVNGNYVCNGSLKNSFSKKYIYPDELENKLNLLFNDLTNVLFFHC